MYSLIDYVREQKYRDRGNETDETLEINRFRAFVISEASHPSIISLYCVSVHCDD